jgi:NAD(P)-dependent dehydrogenase (short-subunit alcohol dehydrogenase family)
MRNDGEKAAHAKREIESAARLETPLADENIITMVCDHSSFRSIRIFCSDLRKKLESLGPLDGNGDLNGIDAMCFNAAVLVGANAEAQFTEDGHEITFQTNHLAPFLIANLTCDLLNPGGRVVVTTSGLHAFSSFDNFEGMVDPETGSIRKRFAMINKGEFNYKKSYSASKLCNVSFCLELNRRLQKKNAIAICFTPGLMMTSDLFRYQTKWTDNDTLVKKDVLVTMDETKDWGGCVLAWMALSDEAGKCGGVFWRAPHGISQKKEGGTCQEDLFLAPLSEEASDRHNQAKLWKYSALLTDISTDLLDYE